MINILNGGPSAIGNAVMAIGALGTASYGLVDVCKALWNAGPSSAGFKDIEKAVTPFAPALAEGAGARWREALLSHWVNGAPLDDQKAKAKALIRLGLTPGTAAALAAHPDLAGRITSQAFTMAAANLSAGVPLTPVDLNEFGRFDAIVSAALDAGFERADQRYRAVARAWACAAAVVLAVFSGWLIDTHGTSPISLQDYLSGGDFLTAVLIGLVSTPLAPVAKDLASSLNTAASAFRAAKG